MLHIPCSMHSSREDLEAPISYIKPARVVPLCAPSVGGPSQFAPSLIIVHQREELEAPIVGSVACERHGTQDVGSSSSLPPAGFAESWRVCWQPPVGVYSQSQQDELALLDTPTPTLLETPPGTPLTPTLVDTLSPKRRRGASVPNHVHRIT